MVRARPTSQKPLKQKQKMKREGRQHGMVRSSTIVPPPWNSRPKSKVVNKSSSPPTAGLYTKVSAKPTNHSKFTGKCGRPRCAGCHTHPVCKSEGKAKGAHKLKACDVTLDQRLIAWRVVDKGEGFNWSGQSATGILGHLSDNHWDEVDCKMEDEVDIVAEYTSSVPVYGPDVHYGNMKDEGIDRSGTEIDGDDMAFNNVGFVWELVDEYEEWYLVGEN